jgi:hypothetical protein
MKKVFVLVLLLVPCLSLVSLDLGVGLDMQIRVDSAAEEGSSTARYFYTLLQPALILMVSPQWEVRPFVLFSLQSESDPDDIASWDADYFSGPILGLGTGLYYHFVQREIINISSGAKIVTLMQFKPSDPSAPDYDSYFKMVAHVWLPVNFDFRLSKRVFFRLALGVTGFQYISEWYEETGVKYNNTQVSILNYIGGTLGAINTGAGFYLMF